MSEKDSKITAYISPEFIKDHTDNDPDMRKRSSYKKGYDEGLKQGCETMFDAMKFLINSSVSEIEKIFGPNIFKGDPIKNLDRLGWEQVLAKLKSPVEEDKPEPVMMPIPGDILENTTKGYGLYGVRILVLSALPGKVIGYSTTNGVITIRGAVKNWKFVAHNSDIAKIYRDMDDPDLAESNLGEDKDDK